MHRRAGIMVGMRIEPIAVRSGRQPGVWQSICLLDTNVDHQDRNNPSNLLAG